MTWKQPVRRVGERSAGNSRCRPMACTCAWRWQSPLDRPDTGTKQRRTPSEANTGILWPATEQRPFINGWPRCNPYGRRPLLLMTSATVEHRFEGVGCQRRRLWEGTQDRRQRKGAGVSGCGRKGSGSYDRLTFTSEISVATEARPRRRSW